MGSATIAGTMRLGALLIDLDLGLAGGERWTYLERVAAALPERSAL